MNRKLLVAGLVLSILSLSRYVEAGLINGSFESGLSGWTTVGPNSSLPSSSVNNNAATNGAFYGNIGTGAGALPVLIHDFVLNNATSIVPASYVSTTFPDATEGGILFQTFTLNFGNSALTFDWNFLTDEAPNELVYNDFAFALLYNNTTSSISGTASIDTFSVSAAGSPTDYDNESGWQSITFGSLTAGNSYTLVFGAFDADASNQGDVVVDSALLIDGVRSVPEPSAALSVILVGILATGLRRRFVG